MKKKSTSPPPEAVSEKDRKHGPEKEKTQITVRFDKDLVDQIYATIKRTNQRVTDFLEEGAMNQLRREDQDLPPLTTQVRFLVANTTKPEQDRLRDYLTFLRADEVRSPSEIDKVLRQFIYAYLRTFAPLREPVRELYARYGRTQDEIEKLTG